MSAVGPLIQATRRSTAGALALLLLLGTILIGRAATTPDPAPYRYVATPAVEFKYVGSPPLTLPTSVAIGPDGLVYVADGVHDRVLIFTAGGELRGQFNEVGDLTLSRPLSVKVDAANQVWIADTGNGRVLVRAPSGALVREIRPPEAAPPEHSPDITDVGISADGRTAWLVDNDNHRVVRWDAQTGAFTPFGKYGESLGQFYYPFMLALNATGDVFVTEAINGRVQILNSSGRVVGSIGAYGPELGDLYRPKGIALDTEGNVWVADGRLGVIQVFRPDGQVLDAVRDKDGKPLKLESPCGIALDNAGHLYVAEELPNRVRQFDVALNPEARVTLPPARQRLGQAQPRLCTACHMEWLEPLAHGVATALVEPPTATRDNPAVSRAANCISCHDGAVADSRQKVWGGHGHVVNVPPSAGISVPSTLPLVDGRIVCRTCHAAHTRGGAGASFATAVFLRVKEDPAELCTSCHAYYGGGATAGMHPLGGMDVAMPAELAPKQKAGEESLVTCLSCHAGHGAPYQKLLRLDTETNNLCLVCHQALKPALFSDATRSKHGRQPTLNAEQRTVAAGFETTVGAGDTLLCVTCHKPHRAPTERYLLAFNPAEEDTCAACHAAQRGLIGTSHDLRTDFPDAKNLLGVTAVEGGACSSCHTAHRYARTAPPTPLDPRGQCVVCHTEGGLAEAKRLGAVNHPKAECRSCHNPHEARFGKYLAAQPSEVCRQCHADRAALAGGPHDVMRASQTWPAASVATHDECLACHRPHGTEETGLFRAGLARGANPPDAACLACHTKSAPTAADTLALVHPQAVKGANMPSELPVAKVQDQTYIACRTCHDPHRAPASAPHLLRVAADETAQSLCLQCHRERKNIQMIGHAQGPLHAAGFETEGCRPCHVVHADPNSVELPLMWPKAMSEFPGAGNPTAIKDHYCLACHRDGGPVAPPAIATHPAEVQMFNPETSASPGYLPLFNAEGREDATGRPGCRTCHLTHGRTTAAPVPQGLAGEGSRELRARAWHIRTFAATNVCTTCHGFDALRRFMYFHDAARRSGPLQTGGGGLPPVQTP